MQDIPLTHDSDYLICAMYKEYLKRRKEGIAKVNAKSFQDSQWIKDNLMPEWSFEDVDETCRELHRAKLLDNMYASNVVYFSCLTDLGIVYMENRFKNNLSAIAENMAKIKALIPFI